MEAFPDKTPAHEPALPVLSATATTQRAEEILQEEIDVATAVIRDPAERRNEERLIRALAKERRELFWEVTGIVLEVPNRRQS